MQRFPLLLQHVLFYLLPLLLGICSSIQAATADEHYLNEVKPLLERKCYACHGSLKQEGELRLDTVELIKRGGDSGTAFEESDWKKSLLWERVTAHVDEGRMPPEGEPLSESELARLQTWLAAGAKGPAQETAQVNPKDHWSFQPLQKNEPPDQGSGKVHPIDALLQQKLSEVGLKLGERAEPHILVRRLFLDLHGLPPAPEDLKHWSARLAESDRGVEDLIDTLLNSPRYGERIAQRWLDLVRYADTHGFEVNTPRPNAWPYRDYVIEAFNEDRSYQDFIREQLIGDQLGVDAATGFLVASAVLLPGQIGKDDASIRLARQDSLDEIIVSTGASFLGLTIGCARCHEHKFDPISQKDYYSLQAFFAGVDYGDRPIRNASFLEKQEQAQALIPQIEQLERKLDAYEPLTFQGKTVLIDDEDDERVTHLKEKNGHGTNPEGNHQGYR